MIHLRNLDNGFLVNTKSYWDLRFRTLITEVVGLPNYSPNNQNKGQYFAKTYDLHYFFRIIENWIFMFIEYFIESFVLIFLHEILRKRHASAKPPISFPEVGLRRFHANVCKVRYTLAGRRLHSWRAIKHLSGDVPSSLITYLSYSKLFFPFRCHTHTFASHKYTVIHK